MMVPLFGLGPHVFEILPLSLSRIEETTTAKWQAVARFGQRSARQFVGLGDDEMTITGLIYNEEFGGFADYLALKETQRRPEPVDMVGWGAGAYAQVFGPVVITEVGSTHEHIGASGIGRKIEFWVTVAPFGGDGPYGGLF